MYYYEYLIILIVLFLISIIVVRVNKKDFKVKINKLIECLGGTNNIIDASENMSRLNIRVKDPTKVDKDGIQKLGAKGIVEIENEFKIILGPNSKKLKKYFKDMK